MTKFFFFLPSEKGNTLDPSLPKELYLEIINRLDVQTFFRFYRTSKAIHNFCNENVASINFPSKEPHMEIMLIGDNRIEVRCLGMFYFRALCPFMFFENLKRSGVLFFRYEYIRIGSKRRGFPESILFEFLQFAKEYHLTCKKLQVGFSKNLWKIVEVLRPKSFILNCAKSETGNLLKEFPSDFLIIHHLSIQVDLPPEVVTTLYNKIGPNMKRTTMSVMQTNMTQRAPTMEAFFSLIRRLIESPGIFEYSCLEFLVWEHSAHSIEGISKHYLEMPFGFEIGLIPTYQPGKYLYILRTVGYTEGHPFSIKYELIIAETWNQFCSPTFMAFYYIARCHKEEDSSPKKIISKFRNFFPRN